MGPSSARGLKMNHLPDETRAILTLLQMKFEEASTVARYLVYNEGRESRGQLTQRLVDAGLTSIESNDCDCGCVIISILGLE